MQQYKTGAVRDTGGKGRMDLLPWSALIRVSKHMEDALEHYPERNWEKGLPMHSMIDSAFRHLAKYVDGMTDEDHLCAAATNLLMAMWTEEHMPNMQDVASRLTGEVLPLASDREEDHEPTPTTEGQEKASEKPESIYPIHVIVPKFECRNYNYQCKTCNREAKHCTCDGDPRKCDFFREDNAEQG